MGWIQVAIYRPELEWPYIMFSRVSGTITTLMFFPELIAGGGAAERTIEKYRLCMRQREKNINAVYPPFLSTVLFFIPLFYYHCCSRYFYY